MSQPAKGETLDQVLQDGDHSFVIVFCAWLRSQTGPGPWVLRVSTKIDGESWSPLPACNSEIKKGPNVDLLALTMTLAAKIQAAVCERFGPSPACRIRIVGYEQGRSAQTEDGYRTERTLTPFGSDSMGEGGVNATYHLTMVGQLHSTVLAATQLLRDAFVQAMATNAKQSEELAVMATTRVVPTASADLGSSFTSLLGPVALVLAWPVIRQLANDPRGAGFLSDMQSQIKRLIAPDAAAPLLPGPTSEAPTDPNPPKLVGPLPAAPDADPKPVRDVDATPTEPPNPSSLDIEAIRAWAASNPEGGKALVVEALTRGGAPEYIIEFIRNQPVETT